MLARAAQAALVLLQALHADAEEWVLLDAVEVPGLGLCHYGCKPA